jgi:hypothetical protein
MKRATNLYVLHYDLNDWAVRTVILIPRFVFALSAIECRKPLAPTARRAGWIGCNILLSKIPVDPRIPVVQFGKFLPRKAIREAYERLRPLENLRQKARLDFGCVASDPVVDKTHFALPEVYGHADSLARLASEESSCAGQNTAAVAGVAGFEFGGIFWWRIVSAAVNREQAYGRAEARHLHGRSRW